MPPTDQFIPLVTVAPSAEKREFQITVIPQNAQPQPFQSMEKGTSVAGTLFKKNCEPSLSVQRDGGRITNIRIQCNCGQTIDLACVYEEAGKATTPKPPAPPHPTPDPVKTEAKPATPKTPAPELFASETPGPKPSAPKAAPAKKPSKK
jgi:hypothetical protein